MANGNRVPTGIVELDALIEGGLRDGKTYLVVGQPGTGKSVLSLQYLVRGLMEKEKWLYVAIDEKPADVIEQATSLGWDLAPFIESKEFLILDASAYFGGSAMTLAKVDVQRVVADLNTYITRMGASRVVIDPVGPLLSRDATSRRRIKRVYFSTVTGQCQYDEFTHHLLGRKQLRGVEEYLVAGTIVLEMEFVKRRYERKLTIEKMRSTAFEPAQYPFNIVADRGIVLQGLSDGAG